MLELHNAMLSKLCTRCVIDTTDNCDTVCHCAPKILSFSFESPFFWFVCLFILLFGSCFLRSFDCCTRIRVQFARARMFIREVLLFCIVVVVVIFVDVVATVLLLWTARFLSPVDSNDIKTHINIYYKWAYFWFIYIKFKWNDNNNDSDDSQNENGLHGTNRQRAHNTSTLGSVNANREMRLKHDSLE